MSLYLGLMSLGILGVAVLAFVLVGGFKLAFMASDYVVDRTGQEWLGWFTYMTIACSLIFVIIPVTGFAIFTLCSQV